MLLDEILELFLYSRKQGLSGAKKKASEFTLKNYRQCLSHFISFMQDKQNKNAYEKITRTDVRLFVEYVNDNKRWKKEATKLTILRALRTFFRFVDLDDECREHEPRLQGWAKVLPPIPRNPARSFIPTPKELKDLRNKFDTNEFWGFRNYVAYSYMMGTGQRINEICWARLEHLQLDENLVYVPEEGKTGSRLVPIDDSLARLLRQWLKKRAKQKGASESSFLFLARGGTQCTRSTFGQIFRKLQPESEKGKRITAHTLRHAFGTYYLRNGGGMERLRMITGHKTYEAMKGYLHLAEVGTQQAKAELEAVSPLKMLSRVK